MLIVYLMLYATLYLRLCVEIWQAKFVWVRVKNRCQNTYIPILSVFCIRVRRPWVTVGLKIQLSNQKIKKFKKKKLKLKIKINNEPWMCETSGTNGHIPRIKQLHTLLSFDKWYKPCTCLNTLRLRQNALHFPNIFQCIFLNGKMYILINSLRPSDAYMRR